MQSFDARHFDVVDMTLVLDTAIYAVGDVLSDTAILAGILPVAGGGALLKSLMAIDQDDQGTAFDVLFFQTLVPLGTFNVAPTISDANALQYLGKVAVAAADFADLGGVRVAEYKNIDMVLKPAGNSVDIYVATIVRSGTPTYTAAGIKLRLGIAF